MEQEKQRSGLFGVVAAMCLVLTVLLTGDRGRTSAVSAPAELDAVRPAGAASPTASMGTQVIPMGNAVGIKLFSDGVLVVGLSPVETADGTRCPGRDSGLKAGDVITHIDGGEVDTIEQVQDAVAQRAGEPLTLQAVRGEQQIQLRIAAVENRRGIYQLGIWLRDSMAGIGTMTFYDPVSGTFAALGHGINDVDTSMLMPLESGSIMDASDSEVEKGLSGHPGELHGEFNLQKDLGSLYANTDQGIFGRLSDDAAAQGKEPVEVAARDQVHTGPATILSNIREHQVEAFAVEITHVDPEPDTTRNMMLEVTDPKLLETTGGIVQGMSGSPILQDGRLVGAVTHVLVNDPTRGYGIFAETMLQAAGT